MDLSNIKTMQHIDMPVYHPTSGEQLDIALTVLGYDSDEYRDKVKKLYQDALSKAPRGDLNKLPEDIDKDYLIKIDALHVKAWNNIEENGVAIEYSEQNAVDLLKKHPWLRAQIKEFVEERANFIQAL